MHPISEKLIEDEQGWGGGEQRDSYSQLYFTIVFLNCISQMYLMNCISEKLDLV